jgi:peptidoglycan/LPS O-acetylase OafA/YrhL
MGGKRSDVLTGIRLPAALAILLLHYGAPLVAWGPDWLERMRGSCYVWTSFFFMLSGFLLGRAYLPKLVRGDMTPREFWARRFARIYPGAMVSFLTLVPLALVPSWRMHFFGRASNFGLLVTGLSQMLLVQAWHPGMAASWNLPAWSMSVVAFAYLAFPWFTVKLAREGTQARRLFSMLGILWALALFAPLAYLYIQPDGYPHVTAADTSLVWLRVLKFNPFVRLPEYLFGVVLGQYELTRKSRGNGAWLGLFSLAVVLGVMLEAPSLPYPLLHNGLLLPAFGGLLTALAEGGGPLAWVLSRKPVVKLAETSLSIYVFQWPLMAWLSIGLGPWLSPNSFAFRCVLVAAVLAVSLLSYHYLERPAEKRVRAWFAPTPVPAPVRLSAAA